MNRIRIPAIIALASLSSIPQSQAQTAVALSPVAKQQFFGANGAPLASGCINTYISGTSTLLPTYTDSTGTTQNANPIILDAGGFASIWLTNSTYRFVLTSTGGVNCATGTLQYTIDGISAYTIINSAQNLFVLGAASDPSGTAGELAYRTDIPCFRGFTTFWDCFVTLTGTQTLTNKTLTAPTVTSPTTTGTDSGTETLSNKTLNSPILSGTVTGLVATNPVINGVNAQSGVSYTMLAADEQKLVTFSNAASIAVTLPQATTAGFGAGTSFHVRNLGVGTVTITPATSTIDGVSTFVLSTGQGADIYSDGTNYETQKGMGTGTPVAGAVNLTVQAANIPTTTIITPSANGFYRIACYIVLTQAATTSSTLPQCQLSYTDPDSNIAETNFLTTASITSNVLGQLGTPNAGSPPAQYYFYAKSGVAIQYATTGYASTGATPMQYAIHIRLEGPF